MTTTQTGSRKTSHANVPPGLEALASRLSHEDIQLLAKRPDVFRQHVETALELAAELDEADLEEAKVQELAAQLAPALGEADAERVAREKLDADAKRKAEAEAQLHAEMRRAHSQEQALIEQENRARYVAERKAKEEELLEVARSSARSLLAARRELLDMHPDGRRYACARLAEALRSAAFAELWDFHRDAELWAHL